MGLSKSPFISKSRTNSIIINTVMNHLEGGYTALRLVAFHRTDCEFGEKRKMYYGKWLRKVGIVGPSPYLRDIGYVSQVYGFGGMFLTLLALKARVCVSWVHIFFHRYSDDMDIYICFHIAIFARSPLVNICQRGCPYAEYSSHQVFSQSVHRSPLSLASC